MHEARSEISHAGLTNYAQAQKTPTQDRFSPFEDGDHLEPEPRSERDEATIASPKTIQQSKLLPIGSCHKPLRPPNPDELQISFLLQSLVRQIDQQGKSHTKAMT